MNREFCREGNNHAVCDEKVTYGINNAIQYLADLSRDPGCSIESTPLWVRVR